MKFLSGCADIENPPACFDAIYQAASCLVDAAMTALEPMLPTDDTCIEVHSFVTFGDRPQPDDNCDQISVQVTEIRPMGRNKCWTHWRVKFRVEAIFSAWPVLEEASDSEVYWPTKDGQEKASRWMYAYGMSFAKELWETAAGQGCTALTDSTLVEFLGPNPSGPRGECAGWHALITLDIPPTFAASP